MSRTKPRTWRSRSPRHQAQARTAPSDVGAPTAGDPAWRSRGRGRTAASRARPAARAPAASAGLKCRGAGPAATIASTCSAGMCARSSSSSSLTPGKPPAQLGRRGRRRLGRQLAGPRAVEDPVEHVRLDRRRRPAEAAHARTGSPGRARSRSARPMTLNSACETTICGNGVTMIGWPSSARTRPTSSIEGSRSGPPCPISRSCRRVVVITPPAIWWCRNAASKSCGAPDRQLLGRGQAGRRSRRPGPARGRRRRRVCPISRRLATVRRASGSDEPLPSGAAADLHDLDAQLGRDRVGQRRQPDRGVRVQLQRRRPERGLDRREQGAGPLGGEDAGRVLDVDPVDVRVGRALRGEVGVEGVVVHGADRVGQRADDLVDRRPASAAGRSRRAASMSCIGSRTTTRSMPLTASRS